MPFLATPTKKHKRSTLEECGREMIWHLLTNCGWIYWIFHTFRAIHISMSLKTMGKHFFHYFMNISIKQQHISGRSCNFSKETISYMSTLKWNSFCYLSTWRTTGMSDIDMKDFLIKVFLHSDSWSMHSVINGIVIWRNMKERSWSTIYGKRPWEITWNKMLLMKKSTRILHLNLKILIIR